MKIRGGALLSKHAPLRIIQVSVGSVKMPPEIESAPLQVILNVSKHLAIMGHEVVILDRKYTKDDLSIEMIEGVQIVRLKVAQIRVRKMPRIINFIIAEFNAAIFAIAVSIFLRRNGSRIDIINLHLTSTGLIICLLNRRLRKKLLYTCHLSQWVFAANTSSIAEKIHLWLDSYLMRRVRKVIALNEAAKYSFISVGKVKATDIVVIPNGVDINFFNPDVGTKEVVKRRYGLEGKTIVLFVGRIAKIKGVEHLVEAANIIVNDFGYKDTMFVLVGPHTYAGVDKPINMVELWENIKKHQLDMNIKLVGAISLDEMRTLYPVCDIFVLPSLGEGDPLAVVEAMASGKPIIGTKVGGIPSKVRDGWNGFLIDPGDERQLADKVKYLLDNVEERHRMGANSRKLAEDEYDWSKVTKRLLVVYETSQYSK